MPPTAVVEAVAASKVEAMETKTKVATTMHSYVAKGSMPQVNQSYSVGLMVSSGTYNTTAKRAKEKLKIIKMMPHSTTKWMAT